MVRCLFHRRDQEQRSDDVPSGQRSNLHGQRERRSERDRLSHWTVVDLHRHQHVFVRLEQSGDHRCVDHRDEQIIGEIVAHEFDERVT